MNVRESDTLHQFTGRVFRLIAGIIDDREEARDLTQDVMVRLLQRKESLRDPSRIKAYVFRSAYHAALNAVRGRKRRDTAHASLAKETVSVRRVLADDTVERAQMAYQLKKAVNALADRQRDVITLRYFGEFTIAEIAVALKISEGTAKVHLARALQNLKSSLATVAGEEMKRGMF